MSHIQREIGKKPVLVFGNSTGDVSMARFTLDRNRYRSAAFMVVADDVIRENGNVEEATEITELWLRHGFIPISMRDDWKTIYGPDVWKR